ncbi:RNA-silencing factor Ers1 [Schizosaccharomyces cryophilus OY26]|uniref:RNA-silencing factor Ers1 n=1 Tax=Schizosaccharomyces cryophilus (strain OY26 / ATCC MYA-4695 / CBS 11777 / NBRC 106824 / NRRL Y48691) TaxID=653667 RepID=S9VPI2_SCHCR|nr:RNA-silencing factor Ers1 [Schizosaccharomyces cryophilus OY26]EPY49828.1 RNA-silencing factor Ers1 [Schizosaccharomyces cryophilus OY26]
MLDLLNRLDSLLAQEQFDHRERNLFCVGQFPNCELKFFLLKADHPLFKIALRTPQVRKTTMNFKESCFFILLSYHDNITNAYKVFPWLYNTSRKENSSNIKFPLFDSHDESVVSTSSSVPPDKQDEIFSEKRGLDTFAARSAYPLSSEWNKKSAEGNQIVSQVESTLEKVQKLKNTSTITHSDVNDTKEKVNKNDQPYRMKKVKSRPPKYNFKLPPRPTDSSIVSQSDSDELVVRRAVNAGNDGNEIMSQPKNRKQQSSTFVCSSLPATLDKLSLNDPPPSKTVEGFSLVSTNPVSSCGIRNLRLCLNKDNCSKQLENHEEFDKQNQKLLYMTLSKSLHVLQSFSGEIHMSLKIGKILYPNLKPEIYQFSQSLSRFYKKDDLPKSLFANCITNSVEEINHFLKRPVIIRYSHSEISYDLAKPEAVETNDYFLFHGTVRNENRKKGEIFFKSFFMRCTSSLQECCFFEARDAITVCNINFPAMPWDARLELHAWTVLDNPVLEMFYKSLCFRNEENSTVLSFNNVDNKVTILSVQRIQENSVLFNKDVLPQSTDFLLKYSKIKDFEIYSSIKDPFSQYVCVNQTENADFSTNYTVKIESPFMHSQFEHNKFIRPTETAKWDLSNPQFLGGAMIENSQDWYTAAKILVKQLDSINTIC